ncbi:LuxR family transcriptional regulator [Streptomyces sp. NPDC093085]|uniref:LuxR family transcriptional regulator n=1 Tax=Streptomyces sp. NPDC093085 TaxID=3155068 RepID=UPI0034208754
MQTLAHKRGPLLGRRYETERLRELIGAARTGRGGALVVRGEAGIGKSTLLTYAEGAASGFRVLRAGGSQLEAELPFAALHQLCLPVLGFLPELPAEQGRALRAAFDLATGTGAPDVFRAALATLGLLTAAGQERPVLCVVDDAHWLDAASAKALAFLARRVSAEPVAMVVAVRVPHEAGYPAGGGLDALPGLRVDGLSDAEARALLAAQSHETLDEQVRDRLVAEARGNPLALLALPRAGGFAPAELTSPPVGPPMAPLVGPPVSPPMAPPAAPPVGPPVTPAAGPLTAPPAAPPVGPPVTPAAAPPSAAVPTRVGHEFRATLSALPAQARLLLTIASADPTGDPGLLWPAARGLDIDLAAAGAAATATGLVEFGTRVRFFHPLARTAAYDAAGADERRLAHRVLAEVTDPVADPDRRAWHRAQAAAVPDEEVAAELERSASRARARGGAVATAAFLERAAELSLDAVRRIERTLAAVRAHLDAGATDRAAALLTTTEGAGPDAFQEAEADLLRGRIALVRADDNEGPTWMLRAARRLAALDPERSRECYLEALETSLLVGRPNGVMDVVLAEAKSAPPHPPDILDALEDLATKGHRAAVPLIKEALDGAEGSLWPRHPALAIVLAAELWDPDTHMRIIEWLLKNGRESGSPLVLRLGLAQAASAAALAGDLDEAMAAIAEEEAIADAVGGPPMFYHRLQLAAMRGRRGEAVALFDAVMGTVTAMGQVVANVHWAKSVLHNGLGEYQEALAAARRATAGGDLFTAGFTLPELVEAAVRCGERPAAVAALESLTERTEACATPSGLGVAAYTRGLVTGEEGDYREAIARLTDTTMLPYRARAHLLYGEWLRRQGRRQDCRPQLRTAHELFSGAGLEAFARRAADELRATGESARSRTAHARDQLTMQELHIARLVATGATSKEVAARLFLSPRTVDTHLRNIYRKLGINSRRQLRDHQDLRPAG